MPPKTVRPSPIPGVGAQSAQKRKSRRDSVYDVIIDKTKATLRAFCYNLATPVTVRGGFSLALLLLRRDLRIARISGHGAWGMGAWDMVSHRAIGIEANGQGQSLILSIRCGAGHLSVCGAF